SGPRICDRLTNWIRSRSVATDGAEDDEENETEDGRGAEGEDRAGSIAGAGDAGRSGAALPGPSQSNYTPGRSSLWSGRHGHSRTATAMLGLTTSARSNVCTPRSGSSSWSAIF